ncbi:MAG: hypothetical protein HY901_17875, partial [Deltaproteobacteria bacterium]|nr:hypothetical protein [Deltaproteobacteria bacterium]
MNAITPTPRMLKSCIGLSVGALTFALAVASCGPRDAGEEQDLSSLAEMDSIELETRWGGDNDRDDDSDGDDAEEQSGRSAAESNLERILNALRPVLQPLFDLYGVPADPIVDGRMDPSLRAMLRDVRIQIRGGRVIVTNRLTGGVIFFGRLSDLSSGTFNAENMPPGPGTTPPATCVYTYSAWDTCPSSGTQTRTVISATPAGCTGTPVLSQPCTYVPPTPVACSYTYSAWDTCQSSGTQTRTVTSPSPAGCSGTPVLSQSCTYVTPACSYTYSAWGACQSNGTQTRTV